MKITNGFMMMTMNDQELITSLQESCECNIDSTPCIAESECRNILNAANRIKILNSECNDLKKENEMLRKALEAYQRERDRYRHNNPEYTGSYFLAGGHGEFDSNCLPQFVRIVPAYGCAWEQIYEKTDKTISYEGS